MREPLRIGVTVTQSYEGDDAHLARAAEEGGLDALWVTDVIGSPKRVEASIAAATLLQATSRIAVGVAVLNAATWYPQALARMAGSLEGLHPRRFILGLGVGSKDFFETQRSWGFPVRDGAERMGFFRDTVAFLDAYFASRSVTFESEFVTAREITASPWPGGRRPVLFIAGGMPSVMRVAASYADMWDGTAGGLAKGEPYVELLATKVHEFREICDDVGRDPDVVRIAPTFYAAVASTAAEAREIAGNTRMVGAATPPFVGSPDGFARFLVDLAKAGATDANVIALAERGSGPGRYGEIVDLIAREVAPAVRAATAG